LEDRAGTAEQMEERMVLGASSLTKAAGDITVNAIVTVLTTVHQQGLNLFVEHFIDYKLKMSV
jgi:hypothetical protein